MKSDERKAMRELFAEKIWAEPEDNPERLRRAGRWVLDALDAAEQRAERIDEAAKLLLATCDEQWRVKNAKEFQIALVRLHARVYTGGVK